MQEIRRQSVGFAELSHVDQLKTSLGFAPARDCVQHRTALCEKIAIRFGGHLIKTIGDIGDKMMFLFPAPDDAGGAAVEMQLEMEQVRTPEDAAMRLRIGLHHGESILEHSGDALDVFGDAVNLAARLLSEAKDDQVLTSGESLAEMHIGLQLRSRPSATTWVKGKEAAIEIHELLWEEEEELTLASTKAVRSLTSQPETRLILTFQGRDTELGPRRRTITLGRSEACDIIVPDARVSRVHARIELRKNHAVLVDESANGAFVAMADGPTDFIHRHGQSLSGQGVIGLGQPVQACHPLAIRFRLEGPGEA